MRVAGRSHIPPLHRGNGGRGGRRRSPVSLFPRSFIGRSHSTPAPRCRLHGAVSIESTLARVSAIRQAVADPSALLSARSSLTGGVEAPAEGGGGSGSSFAVALNQASSTTPTAASSATVALPAAPRQSGISSYAPLPGSGSAAQSVQGLQGVAGSSAPGSSGSVGS